MLQLQSLLHSKKNLLFHRSFTPKVLHNRNIVLPLQSLKRQAEIAQLVEHNLAKVRVASSSLVFRSKEGEFPSHRESVTSQRSDGFFISSESCGGLPLRLRIHSSAASHFTALCPFPLSPLVHPPLKGASHAICSTLEKTPLKTRKLSAQEKFRNRPRNKNFQTDFGDGFWLKRETKPAQ